MFMWGVKYIQCPEPEWISLIVLVTLSLESMPTVTTGGWNSSLIFLIVHWTSL